MQAKSKYAALGNYLRAHRDQASITLTFTEVEQITGQTLPASKRYPAWWSNNPTNNTMTKVWRDAGFETEQVDISGEKLVFRYVAETDRKIMEALSEAGVRAVVAEGTRAFQHAETKNSSVHPAIGLLKGTFTIDPSWDLTKPALDPEELAEWEASLDRKADMYETGLTKNKSGDKR